MKQKTITTSTATILVVELPEGVDSLIVHYTKINTLLINPDNGDVMAELPMWSQLIGRMPELTEEEAGRLIVFYPKKKGDVQKYVTAKDALISLLQSNEVRFENRLGKEPDISACAYTDMFTIAKRSREHLQWELEQEKVWDKNRTYIFKQLK